ncbi:Homeodomain-like superfamily protein [Abeliophyllum distichum]|uniref:Homeodomain-like superfamily protein n=1 Tax=Abeliophyllum distichum TaxID=126358 RepID=A0ABD1V2Y8_9LAMI
MPERKFKTTEQIPTTALRRSPRFLQSNQTEQENPLTKKSESGKIRVPNSCSTPISSSLHSFSNKTQKEEVSNKRTDIVSKRSKILSNGSRRCRRSDGRADVRNNGKDVEFGEEICDRKEGDSEKQRRSVDLGKPYVIERRVTRSSTRGNKNVEVTECVSRGDSCKRVRVLSDEGKAKLGVNLSEQFECNAENDSNDSTECSDKGKAKRFPKQSISKFDDKECDAIRGGGEDKEGNGCKGKTLIHENRSRSRIEEEHSIIRGWTEDQELALQRAYFTAKPTPHFWKKVARMVPGKSAQECFNRIQSENLTPSQPRTRSKARKKNESPLSLSASKLLNAAETKIKKFRSSKRNSLLAQKTVRQILEKQHKTDQDYEADLFTVLEPTTSPSSQFFHENTAFATPEQSNKGLGFLKKCQEKSSSANKKQLSRLKSSNNAAFVSPPVLKQIKNKALHEKYIDQLHWREARRKAASLKNARCIKSKNDSHFEKGNAVKAAKDALIFDTQEAINQIRSQESSKINTDDMDDDCFLSNEDEGEDGFL